MTADRADMKSPNDELSAALAELIRPLDQPQLEKLTHESIGEHRRLLEIAETAYSAWMAAKQSGGDNAADFHQAYVRAMLNNRAQMAVVAALVDGLGHVPNVPGAGVSEPFPDVR
ncbi:hypothetical protein GCM10010869_05630 [Mesorhizobium tianshanense]|uniref:Transcriptional repressor TraM n=1 Tax=Mesorhizobium tianshanense TaxID=39844 RepID=A0A562NM00_9HYPH|nr:transcriptional repressor TraM [Mesorhizobium tianshanense]TWI33153.1 transcriptional repressor TraM [Mesorhizobium tianshanense]GLS34975.1 hypothetical protein GCM10010869_05630 [Mesorhizobium tianshanense]